MNCIFCKIVAHEIPNYTIYEDDSFLAFLDISQATYGHTLLIPKKHFSSLMTTEEETLSQILPLAKKIACGLEKVLHLSNFNFLTNCGELSGQSVMHFHLHIIPRTNKDEFSIFMPNHINQYSSSTLVDLALTIKKEVEDNHHE